MTHQLCDRRPNDLRFCCGGLRRPPPSRQTYPARGRRGQAPVSSKRGLGSPEQDLRPRPRRSPRQGTARTGRPW
jgi:hypothetical protein